jgi:peptidoglycan/xylan/chitin deacetylase (PgdA/CDA1 family)
MTKIAMKRRRTAQWPGNKKLCVTFTVAFEAFNREGSFKRAKGLDVNLHSISHANYGGNAGIWRLMEIMERNDVRSTVVLNGLAAERWPDAVLTLHELGHEIAGHGFTNEVNMTELSPDGERAEVRKVIRAVEAVTGQRPVGWMSPGGGLHTMETMSIIASEGYLWSADQCDDDPPYVVEIDGHRIVVIPKLWFYNDARAWNGGASNGLMAFEAFKEGFDFVYEEALRGRPGRIDATVHAEYAGRPYIAPGFEKMIRYVKSFGDDVWIATCHDMAAYMLKTNLKGEPYRPIG